LPLASERALPVIVNRRSGRAALTHRLKVSRCPEWAANSAVELVAAHLKFILSHPAVTVAIPATTRVDHVRENLRAGRRTHAGPGHAGAHLGLRAGSLMSEWWTYRPTISCSFRHASTGGCLNCTMRRSGLCKCSVRRRPHHHPACRRGGRELCHGGSHVLLAILWIFVGWSFLWNRYAAINWAAAYVAPAFAVEGVLLLVSGLCSTASPSTARACGWIGYFILAFALAGQPLLAPPTGT